MEHRLGNQRRDDGVGQIICDVLEDDYIDWEAEYEAPDDLPDFDS